MYPTKLHISLTFKGELVGDSLSAFSQGINWGEAGGLVEAIDESNDY